jgi:hypothetical protein
MNVINKILTTPGRYDNPIHVFMDEDFGKYLLTLLGPPKKYMVGKVVQIRLEAGHFGSDMVLMRHFDNTLVRHENQSFYKIDEVFTKELNKLFSDVDKDSPEITYTIENGELPEKGFIIQSKIKDGESTPMRDIKNALVNKIAEIIEKESTSFAQEIGPKQQPTAV